MCFSIRNFLGHFPPSSNQYFRKERQKHEHSDQFFSFLSVKVLVLHRKYIHRVINDLGKKDFGKSDRQSIQLLFFLSCKHLSSTPTSTRWSEGTLNSSVISQSTQYPKRIQPSLSPVQPPAVAPAVWVSYFPHSVPNSF